MEIAGVVRLAVVASLCLGACVASPPSMEVVVVIDSDFVVPAEVDFAMITIDLSSGLRTGNAAALDHFPTSFVVVGHTEGAFTGSIQLLRQFDPYGQMHARSFSSVPLVPGKTMMFEVVLPRACLCEGTNCPNPEANPDCGSLLDPQLVPYDPEVVKRGPTIDAP